MSGCPRCASAAPSRKRTSECTVEVGWITTSIRSIGRPNRTCASSSSSPLFARVAESTVIFRPIVHVGCASASSGVTSTSSARVRPRNGPPDAVRTSEWTASGACPSRHWKSAECSLSTGSSSPPPRRCAANASSPAATSDSLFARARSTPRSSAHSVTGSPAKPTTALSTTSGSAASRSAVRSPPTCRCGTPCCAASAVRSCEPDATAHTSKPGLRATTSSACAPIEPVAPMIATRLTADSVPAAVGAECAYRNWYGTLERITLGSKSSSRLT